MSFAPSPAPCLALLACVAAGLATAASAQEPLFGTPRTMLPRDSDLTSALAPGDVDGDGDVDVLLGNVPSVAFPNRSAQNRLYLNEDSTGLFTDATEGRMPVDSDDTRAMELADVDGDGDLDAVLGNWQSRNRLYLNDGAGTFTDATQGRMPVDGAQTNALALGDVDGDGDLDIVFANGLLNRQYNSLYLNDGTATFTDVTDGRLPVELEATLAVSLGDVDGDGDLDIVFGNNSTAPSAGAPNRLYLNDGSGVFTDATAAQLPPDSDATTSVGLGDVDGDGDLDAVFGNVPIRVGCCSTTGGQNRLYLNDGSGLFSDVTATNLPPDSDQTRYLALGDVDGDRDLDALFSSGLYFNDGSGVFTEASAPSGGGTTVALADVDGDHDLDSLTGHASIPGGQNRLYLNDASGVFTEVTSNTLPNDFSSDDVLPGDVDGDGDLDILIGSSFNTANANRIYLNDGSGVFSKASAMSVPGSYRTEATDLGDVDGDQDLDALFAVNGQNALLLNDGSGVFTDVTATGLPPDSDVTWAVALGDVDGDGDLDALLGNIGSRNRLYLNDGGGVFADVTAASLPPDSDATAGLALGDVDGDQDLDALVCNRGSQNRLYLNDGNGVFADVTAGRLPPDSDSSNAAAFGDVDGDGDLDALIANGTGGNRLYLNDGGGVFTDATAGRLPTGFAATLALGDVDGDRDLDALIGPLLYLNDGSGVFTDVTATSVPPIKGSSATAVALADMDGDDDLDGVIGTTAQTELYVNFTRQLAWRTIPSVGRTLTMDLYGPPGGTWVLALSTGTARIRLRLGLLRLDPAGFVLMASGELDEEGRASARFDIPAMPGLIGLPVYWQALVGPPLALTNLEITTLTGLSTAP